MSTTIRPLREADLPSADRIFRLAFGTFLGLPDPMQFSGDADFVRTRWRSDPTAAYAAEVDGEFAGSNFATRWGSFGFFGPLTVHPMRWDQGIASRLLEETIALFDRWGTRHVGLFTFAQSPKHVGLYQKFGFWPRFLTPLMAREVVPAGRCPAGSRYSELSEGEREACLRSCRELTGAIADGLDLEREIRAVHDQGLGDTILLTDGDALAGLAVCHCGPGSEAGSGVCYIKFGAARPGPTAARDFDRLLDACAAFAASRELPRLLAGVSTARHEAYRRMMAYGFRTQIQGVAMHRPNEAGYNRADAYVIDDWR